MNTHIIAIATYGSHRVKHPHTGQMVSAYKLGYSSIPFNESYLMRGYSMLKLLIQ